MSGYPWINFTINLERLHYKAWMQLGECISKCRHLSKIPLLPTVREQLHQVYLAKGIQATTAIEGNTLTEDQVREIIEGRGKVPPSKKYLEQEVKNVLDACNRLSKEILTGGSERITDEGICRFNQEVLHDVPVDDVVEPGVVRKHNIGVGRYRGPEARDVPDLLRRFCDWMNGPSFVNDQMDPIGMGIIKAIAAHVYIAWIHPFGDGNGRTARLLEFGILLRCGVPSPAAHLLSNHYNSTRTEYYRQLDKSSKVDDGLSGFFAYAVEGLRDGLEEQLKYVFEQVISISWEHYIYDLFGHAKPSLVNKRRRELGIILSRTTDPLSKDEIVVQMAKYYAGKTDKTFARDASELEKMELIVRDGRKFRANKELILEFRPFAAQQ